MCIRDRVCLVALSSVATLLPVARSKERRARMLALTGKVWLSRVIFIYQTCAWKVMALTHSRVQV